jgi:hydroxymethylbilane synthase
LHAGLADGPALRLIDAEAVAGAAVAGMEGGPVIRPRIRIGTRGSPLALAQAGEVRDRLVCAGGVDAADLEIVVIRTSGDRIQDRPLAEAGGKGLFTKEIEEALLAGEIDLAVHSMKDVPTVLPDGLTVAAVLPREDVRDAFISHVAPTLDALKPGAVIGTSSMRRAAQVRRLRPDLRLVPFRGNVETRLHKLSQGLADATLLAMAGLNRLGRSAEIGSPIDPETMLPAVAQGAVGIEIRSADEPMRRLAAAIDDAVSRLCVEAERAMLARLEGSCRTPIAGLAVLRGSELHLRAEILTPDGREHHVTERRGPAADALQIGASAGSELLARAGPKFFTSVA